MTANDHGGRGLALAQPRAQDPHARSVDRAAVERAARDLLLAVGANVEADALKETPRRVADAYAELLTPQPFRATTFPNTDAYDELIVAQAIPFHSLCMHHLLPFHGVAHIGYVPSKDGRVTGLSKLARLVEVFARRPQVQERLTTQIADALVAHLHVQGVIVVVQAEHLCMSMRGIRKPGASTITSAVRGQLRDPATRAEAMALMLEGNK